MTWWIWGLIAWSLLASAGVLWLAAVCGTRRRRERRGRAGRGAPPAPAAGRAPEVPAPRVGTSSRATSPAGPPVGDEPGGRAPSGIGRATDDRSSALQQLLDGARAGHYQLPPPLVRAAEGYERLRGLEIGEPPAFGRSDAAAELVAAASARALTDPVALCARIHRSRRDRLVVTEAREVVALAVEHARDTAAGTAGRLSGRIVEDHLRPAHHEVLRQARRVASSLERYTDDDYSVDPRRIVAAGRRERGAFARLAELVQRHRSILAARNAVTVLAGDPPLDDPRALLAAFEDPVATAPTGTSSDTTEEVPLPDDDTARLLWLVSDRAAPAARLR